MVNFWITTGLAIGGLVVMLTAGRSHPEAARLGFTAFVLAGIAAMILGIVLT